MSTQGNFESLASTDVGVIIVSHNDSERTLACLRAIHTQSGVPRRIVVCDNGSDNTVVERLLRGWRNLVRELGTLPEPVEVFTHDNARSPFVLLRNEENEGMAGGANAALRFLLYDQGCKAFWILHNDVEPESFALSALLRHSQDEENIGLVGSTLLLPGTQLLHCAGGGRWNKWTGTTQLIDSGVDRYALTDRKEVAAKMDFVLGASFLVLRQVVEKIGLFSDELFLFYEDVDFGLRAKKAGFKLNWAPGAVAWHHGPDTASLTPMLAVTEEVNLSPAHDYLYLRNRFYLLQKNRPWRARIALVTLAFPLSWRMFRGQKDRLRLVWRAALDGVKHRMHSMPRDLKAGA